VRVRTTAPSLLVAASNSASRSSRYSSVAIALHWAIAALITFELILGSVMESFPQSVRFLLVRTHATGGLLVLVLSVLRVVWRLTHRPPPFSADMSAWERALAHGVHYALYLAMLSMPLIGWAILSAHPAHPGHGIGLVGALQLPPIGFISRWQDPFQKAMHERFVGVHEAGAWILLGLLLLHVAGALKHQWIDKHAQLARMGMGRVRPP
jgi:cytochrome b561